MVHENEDENFMGNFFCIKIKKRKFVAFMFCFLGKQLEIFSYKLKNNLFRKCMISGQKMGNELRCF